MKPSTPEQLARLLDQISSSYPNGIPREAIRYVAEPEEETPEQASVAPYHIFIVGRELETSDAAKELLSAITSKGLKMSAEDYVTTYVSEGDVEGVAVASASPHVLVFGAQRESGWVDRTLGKPVLFTSSLEALLADAALKKALWRDLQALL